MDNNQINLHFWFGDVPSARTLDLEVIAGDCIQSGESVVIYCDGFLPACNINKHGDRQICNACIARTKYHYSLLDLPGKPVPLSSFFHDRNNIDYKSKPNADVTPLSLSTLNEPVPAIGMGPLSSAISLTRDMNFSDDRTRTLATKLLRTSLVVSKVVATAISHYNPKVIVVHNGRLAEYHSVFVTGRQFGVDVITHEVCSPYFGWYVFKNGRIHDREQYKQLIQFSTNSVSEIEVATVVDEYLMTKRHGIATFENFTRSQKRGERRYSLADGDHVISVFTSSEDEFAAIGPEWHIPFFKSQHEGLREIIDLCTEQCPTVRFLIRLHPNMAKMHMDDLAPYSNLSSDNVTVIEPTSVVDSYSVLDDANVVLTFGSTIGIEATYWGKTVIQIGHSLFEHLEVTYQPESVSELIELLINPPVPKSKRNVYRYVYTICRGGFRYICTRFKSDGVYFLEKKMLIPTFGTTDTIAGIFPIPIWSVIVYRVEALVQRVLRFWKVVASKRKLYG